MALRSSPKIAASTRQRVHATAAALGYRPDPVIGKLMQQLHRGRRRAYQSTLYALSDLPAGNLPPSINEILTGFQSRSEALGYAIQVEELPRQAGRLERILAARGVEGLLLLPMLKPPTLRLDINWQRFCLVSCYTTLHLEADSVHYHWYHSLRLALAKVAAAGYRRIGVILSDLIDRGTEHNLSAALHQTAALPWAAPRITHFRLPSLSGTRFSGMRHDRTLSLPHPAPGLRAWLAKTQPDAIILTLEDYAVSVQLALKRAGWSGPAPFVAGRHPHSTFAGTVHDYANVGQNAATWLDQKIRRGERGIPSHPAHLLLRASWSEARVMGRTVLGMPPLLHTGAATAG